MALPIELGKLAQWAQAGLCLVGTTQMPIYHAAKHDPCTSAEGVVVSYGAPQWYPGNLNPV